ncbi:aminomethyltransferase family protein [Rhizobium sp. G21]|uniref:aminomethyltransferase family protein n=1 Tax=Rhizobium sp. G21 TaxID=2758439 RepID=UPI001FF05F5F|nr:aminomethyltransferase family protein [Rhizobium sp. G21]
MRRSNAFEFIGAEARAAREGAALLDTTAFSRYEVSGPGAEAWLDWLLASKLPKSGRAALAPMLAENGKLKGDLSVLNWGDGVWWIMGSYYLREWHMRWFADHMRDNVDVRDISDSVTGFAIFGPKSRDILQKLTHQDVSKAAMPFMACQTIDVGLIRAKVARLSITGELGYEINCGALEQSTLREILLEAGAEFGIREVGFNAVLSMRLEKSFGVWSAEFTQAYTPGETGMDRFIAWDKADFVGRKRALAERSQPSAKVLATIEVDAGDTDASGYEPVWKDGNLIGYVTSGGYGHTIGRSLAMAMIDREQATAGNELTVHLVGDECRAVVIDASPYDPTGKAMRA